MHYLPFLSTLVTFAFAGAVFVRYLKRATTVAAVAVESQVTAVGD